jgi:hypothetical protein
MQATTRRTPAAKQRATHGIRPPPVKEQGSSVT